MKIAILRAGQVDPVLLSNHSEYPDMISHLLLKKDNRLQFTYFDVQNKELPSNIHDFDAYIITGGKDSVFDGYHWIAECSDFLLEANSLNKKLIGICFGHQLLAQTFGGRVIRSKKGWGLGATEFDIYKQKTWMLPKRLNFTLLVSHQDQVVSLPKGAQLLAGNTFCPNACFQLDGNILGMQGHPEFSKKFLTELMSTRTGHINSASIDKAQRSLQSVTHENIIAGWLIAFIAE